MDTRPYRLRIHEYESGKELLSAMNHIRFAAVFLDIQMKELDGEETAKRIRQLDSSLVLVFYTGFAEPSPRTIEVQPYRYIMKNKSFNAIVILRPKVITNLTGIHYFFIPLQLESVCGYVTTQARFLLFSPVWI